MTERPRKHGEGSDPLLWLERATTLLDDRFRIPGTNIRFGIDALIGLVPGLGDVVGFGLSGFLILYMARYGASGMLVVKMLWNSLIDALFGSVPVLGTVFDVGYRANRRNLRLLKEYHQESRHRGGACGVFFFFLLCLIGLFFLFVFLLSYFLSWFFSLF